MRIRSYRRIVCGLLCLQFSASSLGFAQTTTQRQPLGALTATGEVYVNGTRVTGESTIFVGDELRTGTGGAASITASDRGVAVVNENTQLSMIAEPRYFGTLQQGSLRLRAFPSARSFQLRIGSFVAAPVAEFETVADIGRSADGAAQVSCLAGSIAVIALEGSEAATFLLPGQSIKVSPQGRLGPVTPTGAAQQPPTTPPTKQQPPKAPEGSGGSGANKGVIVGVVAAAGAGAALALGRKGGRQAISP